MQSYFSFEILHESKKSGARVGRIHTPHGIIDTPNFVPVGTNACIKAVDSLTIDQLGVQLMFCNTYHLMLHPGSSTVKNAGGLHKFLNRKNPIITDSGGFQVFSLLYGGVHNELKSKGKKQEKSGVLKISEEGVLFRSYRDGSPLFLTPESSVQAQKDLGADIIIPLDELPAYHTDPQKLKSSLDRTHRWQKRSSDEHKKDFKNQAMYAVVHGGVDKDLRLFSYKTLDSFGFDGFAVGGSLGRDRFEMIEMLSFLMPKIEKTKPIHLLGIADIPSLLPSIELGIDTFDSSYPTKCARHGVLFSKEGNMKIIQTKYKEQFFALEDDCNCFTCINYTRAYLHHLLKSHELLFYSLASIHNINFMIQLFKDYRSKILMDLI